MPDVSWCGFFGYIETKSRITAGNCSCGANVLSLHGKYYINSDACSVDENRQPTDGLVDVAPWPYHLAASSIASIKIEKLVESSIASTEYIRERWALICCHRQIWYNDQLWLALLRQQEPWWQSGQLTQTITKMTIQNCACHLVPQRALSI